MNSRQTQLGAGREHGVVAWGLAIGALAGALVLMTMRGPVRTLESSPGFTLLYSAVRAWDDGRDPYLFESLQDSAIEAGVADAGEWDAELKLARYLPSTYAALSPIGMLDWELAEPIWLAINLALLGVLGAALVIGTGLRDRPFVATWFAVGLLAMSPVHTALASGLATIAATAIGVTGLVLVWKKRWLMGGILVGVGLAINPKLIAPVLLALLFYGHWRGLVTSMVMGVGLFGIGMARLQSTGEPWVEHLRANVAAFSERGGVGDPSGSGPLRFQLLNLHYPLYELVTNAIVVNAIVWVVAGVVALLALRYLKFAVMHLTLEDEGPRMRAIPSDRPQIAWRLTASLLVVGLLAMYHRSYDAVVLAVPLAWAAGAVSGRNWAAIVVLVCWATFLTPGGAFLARLEDYGWFSESFTSSNLWRTVILPHQVWALVLMLMALVLGSWHEREQ